MLILDGRMCYKIGCGRSIGSSRAGGGARTHEQGGMGMIKCHLSRIMGERKLRVADVARETGVNRNLVTLLYFEKAKRIDFESLERLCRFFGVGVGDFLEIG